VFATAQKYTITDLGSLAPTGINNLAQVVGNYNNQAYIWSFGQMNSLGILSGGTFSSAAAINDLGTIAGTADGAGTVVSLDQSFSQNQQCPDLVQPFTWTPTNGMHGLGTFADFPNNPLLWCDDPFYATGINVQDQIVGYDGGYLTYQWGFLWTSSNGMIRFGDSWPPTYAFAISDNGQIVGQNSNFVTFDYGHATSWTGGMTTDLGTLGPTDSVSYSSSANGVNNLGQIVGWSTTTPIESYYECTSTISACTLHAVLWTKDGTIHDLGTLPGDSISAASKINQLGFVIGSSGNTLQYLTYLEVIGRPFIWSERKGMQDLNTLIPPNSGWVLNSATDINFWGQIVGNGTLNGQPHGYLLTPKNPFQQH